MELKLTLNKTKESKKQAAAETKVQSNPLGQNAVKTVKDEELENIKRIVILQCCIARVENYSEALTEPGLQLKLVREPNNEYDRWATKVCTLSGTFIGYLPAMKNQSVARLIDAGKNVTAYIDERSHLHDPGYFLANVEDESVPIKICMDIKQIKETRK